MERNIFLGAMSGTSLDGMDLAACQFSDGEYKILAAETIPYPSALRNSLQEAPTLLPAALAELDHTLGQFIGSEALSFLTDHHLTQETIAIASHGHTVVHGPEKGYTLQIGSGAAIAATSGLPAIVDFRSNDVAQGGQGAPLVPIGDLQLFPDYPLCLNLGGICNISCKTGDGSIIGFDICGCNVLLNKIAADLGETFDKDGKIAASGTANEQVITELFAYHITPISKYSMDAAEAIKIFFDIISPYDLAPQDQMATASAFIARMIGATVDACLEKGEIPSKNNKILVTGGGAYNQFLVKQIKMSTAAEIVIPETTIVEFKEALVFAFMGWLRWQEKVNCLASVTGARRNTIGGACYLP